jgi:hypothetical protein
MAIVLDGTLGITSPALDIATPLVVADGGTGLSAVGTSGNVLTSNGTGWVSSAPATISRYTSTAQTITNAGLLTLAHGLGAKPYRIFTTLVCVTAEFNYAIGDELFVTHYQESSSAVDSYGCSLTINATNLIIRYGSGPTTVFVATNKTTGAGVNLTNANWRFYIRAEL